MHDLNRSAIIAIPKQPFLDWLHSVDPTSADITLDDLAREPAIYLIKECDNEAAFQRELRRVAPVIFEELLDAWWTERSDWPARQTYATFRRWFHYQHHSLVFDLCDTRIEAWPNEQDTHWTTRRRPL